MSFRDSNEYKIKLFSILLNDYDDDIAKAWPEFNPKIQEKDVAIYPEEFRIWYINTKFEDLCDKYKLEETYSDWGHEILYFFADFVTQSQLDSIGLSNSTDSDDDDIDEDQYFIREDGQIFMRREINDLTSLEWSASSASEEFYEDLKKQHCMERNIPIEWIIDVGIWG